jgi:triacylglycerol lipase
MNDELGVLDGGGGSPGAALMMMLASISYCEDIPGTLNKYLPDWQAVWQPDAAIKGNYAYIARHRRTGVCVVAIRGSIISFTWGSFYNWFEQDFDVFTQVKWMYPSSPQNPQISQGSSYGLNDLTNLVQTTPGGRTTMLEYLLANVGRNQLLAVTGHSLGGNLATVFAPWLFYQYQEQQPQSVPVFAVYTFAAPTAGNTAFAEAYDAAFPNSWRYHNVLDIIPMASASIREMADLYKPSPQAREIYAKYDGIKLTLAEVIHILADLVPSDYSQTNLKRGSVPLTPDPSSCKPTYPDSEPLLQWFEKAGCEHGHNNYLQLLGATPVECEQVSLTP